jgi:glucosamine--fructose-6-phosphate aminotransferase (isomerizing)
MKEMAYIIAEPYSSADFLHGPVAMMETGFPVMCVLPSGAVSSTLYDTISKIRTDSHVELAVISDSSKALDLAQVPIPLPTGIPEWLSPIISIIPAQLFCYHLTNHKGLNAEQPRNIHKVTETK